MSAPANVAGLPAPPQLEKKPVKFSNLLRELSCPHWDRICERRADRGFCPQSELD
jgi:hypothetical protein